MNITDADDAVNFVNNRKPLGKKPYPYLTPPRRFLKKSKARETRYIRQFRRFKPIIPSLSPACQQAIASNKWDRESSLLVDLAIVQAETRYELEFVGLAS